MKTDVLILGGGPAGGLAALLLARAGRRVVLCEAQPRLPARVCGMYLCPAGVALLERLGLRERLGGRARRLRGMIMVSPDLQRLETFFPAVQGVPAYGLALPRRGLVVALLHLAAEAGAEVRPGTRGLGLRAQEEGWEVEVTGGERIRTRLLVGADGRKSWTARALGLSLPTRRARTALHVDRPARMRTPPMGQMHVFADGAYVGINAVEEGTVNFSLVCDPEALRAAGPVEFINEKVRSSPHLQALMEPLGKGEKPVATFPTNARVRSAVARGAALIGDAAGYIDPLTGEGIYGALRTAEALAEEVTAEWPQLAGGLERYARRQKREQWSKGAVCEGFQQIIQRPWMANGVRALLGRRQAVADAFIGVVGNSYSPAEGLRRMARGILTA